MSSAAQVAVAALLLIFCSLVAAQLPQRAPTASSKPRFVTQLNVSGCPLVVYDSGEHALEIEPIMCVTGAIEKQPLKLDLISQILYIRVPVLLWDTHMLAQAGLQLRNVSLKPVRFATVTNIGALATKSSVIGFEWSSNHSAGVLKIGINNTEAALMMMTRETSPTDALDQVQLTATILSNRKFRQVTLRPVARNRGFTELSLLSARYELETCSDIKFVLLMHHRNRQVRVFQRLDSRGAYYIEPLLWSVDKSTYGPVEYDYGRNMHYLKLDLVLQDEATLDAVRTQLAELSPRSVEFMRLWAVERSVSSLLSSRFEVGPLMVSADWKFRSAAAVLQEYKTVHQSESDSTVSSGKTESSTDAISCSRSASCAYLRSLARSGDLSFGKLKRLADGRWFFIIQQRVSAEESFRRTLASYIRGFGNENNFWIGLNRIASLTDGGATLRVEMKLWNGTEWYAEYSNFTVEGVGSMYRMTYREMLRDKSNAKHDAMQYHKGMQFSTINVDNDRD
uniref:Fibrinogen C-terminal domain-containing protein n=1 Tax=Macrostomum lignano TaxID=282301 RepID=A0A1I8HWT0_9PLAT